MFIWIGKSLHSSSKLTFKKKYLLTLNSSPKIYSVLFNPLNTTARTPYGTLPVCAAVPFRQHSQRASNMKRRFAPIQVQACDRHKLTQGSAAPKETSWRSLWCTSTISTALPGSSEGPTSSRTLPGRAAGGARVLFSLIPSPGLFINGKSKTPPNVISWITASTKKRKSNFRFDGI